MMNEAKEESRLIELNGVTTGILSRNQNHVVFYFRDEVHGEILVTADKECPLYYGSVKRKRLHLKVYLRGHTVIKHGGNFTNNYLVIKEVLKQEDM
jgi:hypothetical protein